MRRARYELFLLGVPIFVYVGLVVGLTWPFLAHPQSTLTAPIGFDVNASIGKYHALAVEKAVPFTSGVLETIGYPEGVPKTPALDIASALSTTPLWLGSLTIGAVATHGFQSVLGLVLTALVTFLFVRRVTGLTGGAFIAGRAYCSSPPHRPDRAGGSRLHAHVALHPADLGADGPRDGADASQRSAGGAFAASRDVLDAVLHRARARSHRGLRSRRACPARAPRRRRFQGDRRTCDGSRCGGCARLCSDWSRQRRRPASCPRHARCLQPVGSSAHVLASGVLLVVRQFLDLGGNRVGPVSQRIPRRAGSALVRNRSLLGLVRATARRDRCGRDVPAAPSGLLDARGAGPCRGSRHPRMHRFVCCLRMLRAADGKYRATRNHVSDAVVRDRPCSAGPSSRPAVRDAADGRRRDPRRHRGRSATHTPRPEIQIAATVAVAAIVATDLWARAPESVVRLPNSDALATLREEPSAPAIHYIPEGLLAGRITAPCLWQIRTRQNARESVQHHVLPAAPFRAQ